MKKTYFGSDAAAVSSGKPEKNARVLIATYQTLDVDSDDGTANFLRSNYPDNYFSHIVIDECHRSAWGKWSQVLTLNPDAVQIGLTATPRQLRNVTGKSRSRAKTYPPSPEELDARILADNLKHFGSPVYEYDVSQGIEDGYLAACEIVRRDMFLDDKPSNERASGIARPDLANKVVVDANTGEAVPISGIRERYDADSFEALLLLPERVAAMTLDLFHHLLATGGPEQKTIIFCVRDRHADVVATAMNNLYADWCAQNGRPRLEAYAFKCTGSVGGADYIADLRAGSRHHFIATTVDLLTTGVDVPAVCNIVFFRYVASPIAFYQMVGRGTRLDPPTGKVMFRVYDYTDATRLFGKAFITKSTPHRKGRKGEPPSEPTLLVEGFDVRVTDAGRYIITQVDGTAIPVTVEEYKQRLAARLVEEAPTVETFRSRWIAPAERREMLGRLPDAGRSATLVRALANMSEYDLYDVLADLGYGLAPRTRTQRADAFIYKHQSWLSGLPAGAAATLKALTAQFARAGTEGLENPQVFQTPEVARAGGLTALRALGRPVDVLHETKERIFAV